MPYMDIPTGFTGFTVDVFHGSTSDSEGDVTKVLFAITFQEKTSDVQFSITNGNDHWSALAPTGEYIGLKNPQVVQTNRDSAIVLFDMDEKYPSNSLMTLCARNPAATYNVNTLDYALPFTPNTITGAIGFTSNEYGGGTNEEGEVERIVFNVSFATRRNEVEFEITEGDDDWACLMGDGSQICLKNPHVLFQNRDGATIVFQMYDPAQNNLPLAERWCGYPSNSPGVLVRRHELAKWTISEIDEDHPFIPVQSIVFPTYIPVGERISLHSQVVVYPMNSTLRGIEWSIKNAGATEAQVSNGWITTVNPGKITLTARIPNGGGIGTDFYQDVDVHVIENWITVEEHPHLANAIIAGRITEELAVIATTEFGDITYQWFKSNDQSNEYGTPIANATEPIYKIPKHLVPGNYYYFCEIRKTNFPSVRTKVAYVRVRDDLRSLSIYPSSASIPPGSKQQFAVDRNPTTSDEAMPTLWFTSDSSIVSIDENGLATAHNPGNVMITARIGEVWSQILVRATYVPVNSIQFDLSKELEAGNEYQLPTVVTPSDASYRDIIWEVISGGTTGATISNGVLRVTNEGKLSIRGTIVNGMNPTTNFSQEFSLEVKKAYVPVSNIGVAAMSKTPRVGELVALHGTIVPANADSQYITWSIVSAGSTRAKLTSGNLLTVEAPGVVTICATVANGISKKQDFKKNFDIEFKSAFIPVQSIDRFPESVQYYEGKMDESGGGGIKLNAKVLPENADYTKIEYRISENDESGLQPKIVKGTLFFDPTGMSHEDEISIRVKMTVVNGLDEGVDYINEALVYVHAPASPEVFVPILNANWNLPSVLRAYRPIIIDKSEIVPYDSSRKNKIWSITREGDIEGSSAIMFLPTDENHADLVANGVLFDEEFDWTVKGNYIYPMSAGKLRVKLAVMDGLEIGTNFVDERVLDIKDPFIPVLGIKNMPSTIYAGSTYYLSPEVDTGNGVNEQTAMWDDRVPTYGKMQFTLLKGNDIARIDQNTGNLTASKSGEVQVLITIPNGLQEDYEWHGQVFEHADFTQKFNIKVEKAQSGGMFAKLQKIITLTLANKKTVNVYTRADYDKLRAIRPADSTLSINGTTFARKDVVAVNFESSFKYTDLSNFGRNMTKLTKINKIPDSARNLRNFLMGCTSFNQAITIPKNVNGDRCLEGFLRDCKSFNQYLVVPSVGGSKCMESFLRGCSAFNKPISLPKVIRGNYAMYSFMMGCTAFNSRIVFPEEIYGIRCMENVLRDCVNFNQQITLPKDISGHYNFAAFMFNCKAFTKPVIVPTEDFGEHVINDVITLATFYRDCPLAKEGTAIYGPGAAKFQERVGNQGSAELLPLRTLNLNGEEAPEPEIPEGDGYVGITLHNEVEQNLGYDDYAVGDDVNFAIRMTNNSEKLSLTNIGLEMAIPDGLEIQGFETTKDIKVIKLMSDDTTVEEIVKAPVDDTPHEHTFGGDYQFDADGHWQKCTSCDVLSQKEEHTPNGEATETEHSICSVCGYVIEHAHNGVNAGDPDCEHLNTELRNVIDATTEAEGYSGDLYCVDCDRLIAVGHVTPKLTVMTDDWFDENTAAPAPANGASAQADETPVEGTESAGEGETEGAEEEVKVTVKSISIALDELDLYDSVDIRVKTKAVAAGDMEVSVIASFDEADKQESNDSNVATVEFTVLEEHAPIDPTDPESPDEGSGDNGGDGEGETGGEGGSDNPDTGDTGDQTTNPDPAQGAE